MLLAHNSAIKSCSPLKIIKYLTTAWLGMTSFNYCHGASNFVSTMIGGGYAFADKKMGDLETFQNFGQIRLGQFLSSKHPVFLSMDLESFRLQRKDKDLDHHHYGEGGGIGLGLRGDQYGFWLQLIQGQLRNFLEPVENSEEIAQRYKYQSVGLAIRYSIYAHEHAAIEFHLVNRLNKIERGWVNTYGYKNLHFLSLLLSFTLFEIT